MRRVAGLALAILIAGCSQKPGPPENQAGANEKVTAEANVTGVTVDESNGVAANQAEKLPPAHAALRFVGSWAKSQAECTSKPWKFTADTLTATDGPKCSFYKVTKSPAGYDIAATCPAKVPVHTDLIRLQFAESAGAMLVESNAISPTGLIYCGK